MAQSPPSPVSTPTPATISSNNQSSPRAPPTPPPESDSHSSLSSSPRTTISEFPAISASSSPAQSTITSFPSSGHPTFASVVASPSLPTSVSSPAWFPAFNAEPDFSPVLVPSSTCATLVDYASDSGTSPKFLPSTKILPSDNETPVHEITQHPAMLEEGEIAKSMKDLSVQSTDNSGNVLGDSPILPSQKPEQQQQKRSSSPPRAPSRPTIPLPPIDDAHPLPPVCSPSRPYVPMSPSRQRQESEPIRLKTQTLSPLAPAESAAKLPTHTHVPADPKPPGAYGPASDPEKTPNVYINGLPPNFPEDQLFALAAPFGAVRSVRSFTRHVGDTETGYGFVLFEDVACAEKCINSLRRYRNLHPTFSKVHKIPGTVYAQPRSAAAPSSDLAYEHVDSASSLAGWEQESAGEGSADSTFKAKMERLADKASTNLYIEGLPLSIDDTTLAALVSPYSIRSSRFFQTKLSTPPRIIAFVRLETRAAAEEIIDRLHGRMVRGWNDPGSRISVRFADTSEQRELRRQERVVREGDQAGNQLSIAQATLLNLRGKELNPSRSTMGSGIGVNMRDDFRGDVGYAHNNFPADVGYSQNDFEVDYSRVPARYPPQFDQQHPVPSQRMNNAMASLLESLQANARSQERDTYAQQEYRALQQQQLAALSLANGAPLGAARPYLPQGLGVSAQHAPHGGYTAAEEFILRARSNSLPQVPVHGAGGKRRPTALDLSQAQRQREQHEIDMDSGANISVGVRGYRTQAATLSFPHQQQQSPLFDPQHELNEEDFHAASSIPHQMQHRTPFDSHSLHPQQQRISHSQQQQPRGPSQTRDFGRTSSQQSLATDQQHHYHRNLPTPTHSRNISNNSNMNNLSTSHGIYDRTAQRGLNTNTNTHRNGASSGYNSSHSHSHSHSHSMYSPASDDQASPPLVSPALTYSSRSSASAVFSPSTPFFGNFDEDDATFRAAGTPHLDATKGPKKMNARTATR